MGARRAGGGCAARCAIFIPRRNTLNPPCPPWGKQPASETRDTFRVSGATGMPTGAAEAVRSDARRQGWVSGSSGCTWGGSQPLVALSHPCRPPCEPTTTCQAPNSGTTIALRGNPPRHHDHNIPPWCAPRGAVRLARCADVCAHLLAERAYAKSGSGPASANPAARRALSLNQGGTMPKEAAAAALASYSKDKVGGK